MKILHRYLLRQLVKNLFVCLAGLTLLFLVFDFFDRVDRLIAENASLWDSLRYFLLKVPLTLNLMLPIATLVATLFTIGMLSKNSEITAMRCAGLRVLWLAKPLLGFGLALSFFSLLVNETIVPWTMRRVNEIYNIDIKKKDKKGGFSQSDFWWRDGNKFYSAGIFDSRTNSLAQFSEFDLSEDFRVSRRVDADKVDWVNPTYRWSMRAVWDYRFPNGEAVDAKYYNALPLLIDEQPTDFYETRADPYSMSFSRLRRFIKEQKANGVPINQYLADLNEKISFPFINLVVMLVVMPFALKPARSGSLAPSFVAGVTIGFSYYAIHSFSLAMGRAELWPPVLAAWVANFLLIIIGLILNAGAESPA